jgi:predicted nuclease of predicted toxin-antitoxin system
MKKALRFLVDEDLPRPVTSALNGAGFRADDVRDVGLRGKTDEEVLSYARAKEETVLTADRAFGSTLRFPLGTHKGIIVIHYPDEMPIPQMIESVVAQLRILEPDEVWGSVVVLEQTRVRLRSVHRES